MTHPSVILALLTVAAVADADVARADAASAAPAGVAAPARRPLTPAETAAAATELLTPVESTDIPFDRSTISFTVRGTAPSTFDGERYQEQSAAIGGALSLYSRLRAYGDRPRLFRLSAQFRLERERVDSALVGDPQVTKAALGLTAMYLSSALNVYALYVGVGMAEAEGSLDEPTWMPSAIGLGTHRHSARLTWIYGGGLGYALGRPWLLPVGGLAWTPRPGWSLSMLLPVSINLRHAFTRALGGEVVLAASGDRFGLDGAGALAGQGRLQLRLAQARLGAAVSYRFGGGWAVRGEVGVVGPRRLTLLDEADATVLEAEADGAGYLSLGVTYAFGNAWI